jgi:hypothetical protein
MVDFRKFTAPNGDTVHINVELVTRVFPLADGTKIGVSEESAPVHVTEAVGDVTKALTGS